MDPKENEQTATAEETTHSSEETTQDEFNPKEAFEKLQNSLDERFNSIEGRIARETKKEKKSSKSDETSTSKNEDNPYEFGLLEQTYLQTQDVKSADEEKFVKEQLKELGLTKDQLPKLFQNKYFQAELQSYRDDVANKNATSDVQGGKGTGNAKLSSEYWIKKGVPPTPEDVPDRKTRAKIARDMMESTKNSKKFYND